MRRLIVFIFLFAVGLAPVWAVPSAQEGLKKEAGSVIEKYSFTALPEATEVVPVQGHLSPDEATIQDRKEDRTFKFNALIALSLTTITLYLVSVAVMFKLPGQPRGGQVVQLTSLALIVYSALALAIVATSNEGLNAPIGILGALAGYLFGHSSTSSPMPEDKSGKV